MWSYYNNFKVNRGTGTGVTATIHSFLRDKNGDKQNATDSVLNCPSTQNKIETWWRELLDRMEEYFKKQLTSLVEDGEYDSTDETDRYN